MQIRTSIKQRCPSCKVFKRNGVVQRRCKVNRRHNARQPYNAKKRRKK